MKNNILNIQFEILTLIFLGVLYFYFKNQKEIKGYKVLKTAYIFAFTALLADIACRILHIGASAGVLADVFGAVYCVLLSLIGFCWLIFCAGRFGYEQFRNLFVRSVCAMPVLIVAAVKILYGFAYESFVATMCIIYPLAVGIMAVHGRRELSLREKDERRKIVAASLPAVVIGGLSQTFFSDGLMCAPFGIAVSLMILLIDSQHDKIVIDRLTKLHNRYGMDEEIDEQLEQYKKDKTDSFYVIACDMDDFKTINDTWGHAEGDRALRIVADVLTKVSDRNNAIAFRNGGDEFVIITDKSDKFVADTICAQVESEFEKVHFRDDYEIKISMGIALYDGKTTVNELLNRADGTLYDVKRSRKQVR